MEPLQGVENDIARKNYVPSSFKNSCPGIKTLNHIEPVKVFVEWLKYGQMLACNLHCVIFLCIYFSNSYCVICIVLLNALFCTV